MATLILDRELAEKIRLKRAECGGDRWDEVWEGTYVMAPLPNNEHQEFVSKLASILYLVVDWNRDTVLAGTNVSDRRQDWTHNYRCPDVAVYLYGNPAKNCGTHWLGGPDMAIEVVSPDDRSYDKIPFYESVGTRELLLIDRHPWQIELLRLDGDQLVSAGVSRPEDQHAIHSMVLPITFQLLPASGRPQLVVSVVGDDRRWII
ncbi:MAG: Uma2 family endonuclease [Pirellulales bacterium]